MSKPKRTFSANVNQYSTGVAGPDQIEQDLDSIFKMFDPSEVDGGIGTENIQDGAGTDVKLGNRTIDSALEGGANTGTVTQILSWLGKLIKSITGKTNWFDNPSKSIEDLISYDASLLAQMQAIVLGQIPDGTLIDDKLTNDAEGIKQRFATHLTDPGAHGQRAKTYYVDASRPDNSGDGLTPGTAFKSIQYALNLLKKYLVESVTIRILAGDYSSEGQILAYGFYGPGQLSIVGYDGAAEVADNIAAANYKIDSILFQQCNIFGRVQALQSTHVGNDRPGFYGYMSKYLSCLYCNDTVVSTTKEAFKFYYATVGICSNCISSNKNRALISGYGSVIFSYAWSTGSGNITGLLVECNGEIGKSGTQPQGTTAESVNSGGAIR